MVLALELGDRKWKITKHTVEEGWRNGAEIITEEWKKMTTYLCHHETIGRAVTCNNLAGRKSP